MIFSPKLQCLTASRFCTGSQLFVNEGLRFDDPSLYRSTVGSLQYLTLTRPETIFAVNQVYQFMHRPTNIHWATVKRILRYLNGTVNHGLLLRPSSVPSLLGYSNADWADNPDDRRLVSGFIIFLGFNPISWSSKKQRTVARSSTKS